MNERLRKMACQLQCAPAGLIIAVLLFVVLDLSVSWSDQHATGLTQAVRAVFASVLCLGAAGLVAGVTTAVGRQPVIRRYPGDENPGYDLAPFRRHAEDDDPARPGPAPAPALAPAVILKLRPETATTAPGSPGRPERAPEPATEVPR